MESHLTEELIWATGLAGRLRLVQADCADDLPATRQEYVADEIGRALKEVVPSKKKAYLQALADQFPAWQIAPLPATVLPGKPEITEDTPENRLESLLAVAPNLSAEQRKEFASRLSQAGIITGEAAAVAVDIPPDLQKRLGLASGQTLQPERAMKLLAVLLELALTLDQLVWNLWKQLAPKSNFRREAGASGDLRVSAGKYLGGDPEISTQQLTQMLDQSRKLTAGLLMAIGGVGRTYAKRHLERFSPDVIRDLADMEKGWAVLEQKCWRKYVGLAGEFATEPYIEKEIQDAIARYAEEVMRGRLANPAG